MTVGRGGPSAEKNMEMINRDQLKELGDHMRLLRLGENPPATLIQIGTDPIAPRSWSHSHLSRVERGFLIPGYDLVEWYENRCGAPTGILTAKLEQIVGPRPEDRLSASGFGDLDGWRVDRLESTLDLRGPPFTFRHVRDLLAMEDGLNEVQFLLGLPFGLGGLGDDAWNLHGGVFKGPPCFVTGDLAQLSVTMPVALRKGTWHRITVECRLPSCDVEAGRVMLTSPTAGTRELVSSIAFPEGIKPRLWEINRMEPELVAVLNNGRGTLPLERYRELEIDRFGEAANRVNSPRPGFAYGLAWGQ